MCPIFGVRVGHTGQEHSNCASYCYQFAMFADILSFRMLVKLKQKFPPFAIYFHLFSNDNHPGFQNAQGGGWSLAFRCRRETLSPQSERYVGGSGVATVGLKAGSILVAKVGVICTVNLERV